MLGVGVAAAVGMTGCGKSDASSDSEETAKTEDIQETADTKEESEPSENTKKQDSEEKDKTETVYVKSDAKGNPREITVQTKLKKHRRWRYHQGLYQSDRYQKQRRRRSLHTEYGWNN